MQNPIATVTKKTVRIHRANCKKAAASYTATLGQLTDIQLEQAKAASCCKPNNIKVVEALVAETEAREEAARQDYLAEADETEQAEVAANQAEANGDHVMVELPFNTSGVAKHYWKVFCRQAAYDVALAFRVLPTTRATQVRLRGQADQVNRAGHTLRMIWGEGYDQFKHWRKTDADHLAIKAPELEAGVHWNHSERGVDELNWLAAFVAGVVAFLQGKPLAEEGNAFAQGYTWAKDHELDTIEL